MQYNNLSKEDLKKEKAKFNRKMSYRLTDLRETKGLTKKEAAYSLGISYKQYCFYEEEKTRPPILTLKKIVDLYETTAEYILRGKVVQVVATKDTTFDKESVGRRIKLLYENFLKAGNTRSDVLNIDSHKVGLDLHSLYDYIHANNIPSYERIIHFADIFEVTVDYILFGMN